MDLSLRDKHVLITGASRGIGYATAQIFAEEGAALGICARGRTGLDKAKIDLARHGVPVVGDVLDILSGQPAIKHWVDNTAAALSGIDIVVSNVSAGAGQDVEASWDANFRADLMGSKHLIDACLPHLVQSKEQGRHPSIVLVASIAALEEFGGISSYGSMKAALTHYAASLSQALAPHGIRVNTVSPGVTHAPDGFWDQVKQQNPEGYGAMAQRVPLGGRMASAAEIGRAIVFAASPAASYMTGANMVVDGGLTRRVQY